MPNRVLSATRRVERDGPNVRVAYGPAFELVAELAAFTSGPARASLDSGKAWIREVRSLAGTELVKRVERYTLGVYAELATVALEAPKPRGAAELIATLEAFPADALRRRLLGADSPLNRSMLSDGAFKRALAGDAAARTEIPTGLGADRSARQAIERLLDSTPDAVKAEILGVVADWTTRVFPRFASDAAAAIDRDAAARERQLGGESGRAVLAAATNGVAFNPSPWVTEIVIVPTVALRPFIIPIELRHTAMFIYSVADEAFDVDPAAPPRRLVKVAAALGDELRLRVLHVLRDESLSASEIADRLDVDRTSLHHHLGILRSAGLLTIRDDGVRGWHYALREDGLEEVGPALATYLRPPSRARSRRTSRTHAKGGVEDSALALDRTANQPPAPNQ
jgi:DNA-binding transcriptional ArsR family regulator